jgi:hypothetical protein
MVKKNIVCILLFLYSGLCFGQEIKVKVLEMKSPAIGRYKLHILPLTFDSTVTEAKMVACVDSMPGHLFGAKMYDIMYSDDSTRLAARIDAGRYFFHKKFTLTLYWKNGNKRELALLNRHYRIYKEWSYYQNAALAAHGRYKHGHKKHRWVYFNSRGLKIKAEKYAHDGTVKKTKTIDPPKKTLRTIFNPLEPSGAPYIIY